MQKNIFLIALLIIVLLTGFFLTIKIPKQQYQPSSASPYQTPAQSDQISRGLNQYQNNEFNFSLNYPFNLQLKEASSTSIIIGTINDLETISEVEIDVIENLNENLVLTNAKKICSKIINNIQSICTFEDKMTEKLTNTTELINGEIYFQQKLVNMSKQEEVLQQTIGPFIPKKINSKNKKTEAYVIIHPPVDRDQKLVNTQLIRDIADSLILTSFATPSANLD